MVENSLVLTVGKIASHFVRVVLEEREAAYRRALEKAGLTAEQIEEQVERDGKWLADVEDERHWLKAAEVGGGADPWRG